MSTGDSFNGSTTFVEKLSAEDIDVAVLERPCFKKYFLTAHADSGLSPYTMFERLGEFVAQHDAKIIQQHVFGGCQFHEPGMEILKKTCGEVKWPVSWIQGDECSGEHLTATQVYAISGSCYKPVEYKGQTVGALYEDDDARYCLLGDLRPDNTSLSNGDQTRAVFEKMEAVLETVGMDFSHVVRTWLYLNDLLSWYDELNAVRTTFFNERGVFDGLVPASTGIGVCNPSKSALVTDLFAVQPKTDRVKIEAVPSPLQCSAEDYKSSFSRAIEVALPDHRTIYISGTASIAPGGETVHIGDVKKQIALTMEVADAILQSRNMSYTDMVRGIAYFKDIADAPLLGQYCKEKNLPQLPFAVSHSDVCRDDLLFEIELDAAKVS
jgi:enamine deaminase RidA (YjgF/YER057c/UK114 family)